MEAAAGQQWRLQPEAGCCEWSIKLQCGLLYGPKAQCLCMWSLQLLYKAQPLGRASLCSAHAAMDAAVMQRPWLWSLQPCSSGRAVRWAV